METLSDILNFDARYLVYPVLALIVAAIVRFIFLRILRKWASRTKTGIDDRIITYLETLVTPVLLLSVLYYLMILLPLNPRFYDLVAQALSIRGRNGNLRLIAIRTLNPGRHTLSAA